MPVELRRELVLIFIYIVFESYTGVNSSLINTFVLQTILLLLCFYLLFNLSLIICAQDRTKEDCLV